MVPIIEFKQPIVVATKTSQLVQLVVEPIQIENPSFFITQHVLVSGHSIDNLRHISMFLEQAVDNATT